MACDCCGAQTADSVRLCRECARTWAAALRGLLWALRDLSSLRPRHGQGQGGVTQAFPGTPASLEAIDLLDEADDSLQQIASDMGLWAIGWQKLLLVLLAHAGRANRLRHPGQSVRRVQALTRQAQSLLRVPVERRVIGRCPGCGQPVSAADEQQAGTCHNCGQSLDYQAMRADRLAKLTTVDKIVSAPVASHLVNGSGVKLTRDTINHWHQRGRLRAVGTDGQGRPLYSLADIISLVLRGKSERKES